MHKSSHLLWLLAVPLLLTACGSWKDFPVAGGTFSVKTAPNVVLTCETKSRTDRLTVEGCISDAPSAAYIVIFDKFAAELPAAKIAGALDGFIDFQIQHTESKLVSKKSMASKGWQGMDFQLDSPHGKAVGRVFIGGNMAVSVLGVAKNGTASMDDLKTFATSLHPVVARN